MKYKIILIAIFISTSIKCYSHSEELLPYIINGFIGINVGIGESNQVVYGFDSNIAFAFFNGGFTFRNAIGSNSYVGLGYGTVLQLQYGFCHSLNKNYLRFRSDIPLVFLDNKYLKPLSIGIYLEGDIKNPPKIPIFGLNFNYSLSSYIIGKY